MFDTQNFEYNSLINNSILKSQNIYTNLDDPKGGFNTDGTLFYDSVDVGVVPAQ